MLVLLAAKPQTEDWLLPQQMGAKGTALSIREWLRIKALTDSSFLEKSAPSLLVDSLCVAFPVSLCPSKQLNSCSPQLPPALSGWK